MKDAVSHSLQQRFNLVDESQVNYSICFQSWQWFEVESMEKLLKKDCVGRTIDIFTIELTICFFNLKMPQLNRAE